MSSKILTPADFLSQFVRQINIKLSNRIKYQFDKQFLHVT